MKKILLVEDRAKRQQLFMNDTQIDLTRYCDILDNYIEDKYNQCLNELLLNNFNLNQYDIIISHKSAFGEDNNKILHLLKEHCKEHKKSLILFSGGISANYYNNEIYEVLELNSKTFYSENLKLFLESVEKEDENILMLCYGNRWKLNIILNILEKLNLFIEKNQDLKDIQYSELSIDVDIDKLNKIDYKFYEMIIENGWVYLMSIIQLRDSIFNYISELADE